MLKEKLAPVTASSSGIGLVSARPLALSRCGDALQYITGANYSIDRGWIVA